MQNFILLDDFDAIVKSHPLIVGYNLFFEKKIDSVQDLLVHKTLNDVENSVASHEDYIVTNMFKKLEDDLGLNPDAALLTHTYNHFIESSNRELNFQRLLVAKPANIMRLLERARETCHRILGSFNPWDVKPRLTFGATEDLERSEDVVTRMRNSNENSLNPLGNALKHWYLSQLPTLDVRMTSSTNDGSYVAYHSVSKTLKIARPIGYHEPIQLAVQCGTGDLLASLLHKHTGINISTAQDWHKFLVEYYSTEPGFIATMDQSDASQNILRLHAEFLLPSHVWDHLNAITPPQLLIEGKKRRLPMLAAQGNGYIFALQTIIFYALIHACMDTKEERKMVFQYGDDSIFPALKFKLVTAFFEKIGFTINKEKSFTGSVLESCGADYHNGINVRPFYVKNLPSSTTDWYHVCNGIYRVGYHNNGNTWRSRAFRDFWLWCINHIPASQRFYGPAAYGDDVITHLDTRKYIYNSSGTSIKTLGLELGSGVSFSKLWDKIPANNVGRFCIHPSLLGAGLIQRSPATIKRIAKKINKDVTEIPVFVYPAILGPRTSKTCFTWKQFPVSVIPSNSDVDDVFKHLSLNSEVMQDTYNKRRSYHLNTLIRMLKDIKHDLSRNEIEDLEFV